MIAFLLHAFYSTGLAYLLSSVFDGLSTWIAVFSLVVGWVVGHRQAKIITARAPGLKLLGFSRGEAGALEGLLAILIFYACFRHFAWLFFPSDGKWMTLSANNFGDLPLHINYIRTLAAGVEFPIPNPSFASESLKYPFGPDLYSALWESVGVPLRSHLFLVGLAASAVSIAVLRWFGGWWALGAFFFSGGLTGFLKFKPGVDPQSLVDWKNLLLAVFITQRGVLFALPAALLLIELWRKHVNAESSLDRRDQFMFGLVWGLLPLFHAHAFIAVSIIMMGLVLIEWGREGFSGLFRSHAFMVAVLPAFFFVYRTTDGFKKSSVSRFDGWWTSNASEAARFMWLNFGLWLVVPVAIALAIHFMPANEDKPKAKRTLWLRFALALGLFVLWFNWMLAPWSWDNIKLLIWPYLMLAQLANETIDWRLPRFTRYPIAVALFGSGFVAIAISLGVPSQKGLMIYQERDLNAAAGALVAAPDRGAVFLAAPTHDHPLSFFGRLRVMGYEGHLWSHGIDSARVRDKVDAIFKGSPDWLKSARELGVEYIYWGLPERVKYGESPARPWMTELENVSRVPEVAIYRLPSDPAAGAKK